MTFSQLVGDKPPKSTGKCAPSEYSLFSLTLDDCAEDAAKIPLKLAVGDIGGASGEYWANDSMASAADGKVQEW